MSRHLENHIHKPHLCSDNTMHVIGVCSNPVRYHSRYRLFREWREAMEKTANVKVYVVEAAFGDRQFEVTSGYEENELQLRINQDVWIKENLINLAEKRLLPRKWNYLAWVDADVFFHNPGWALETLHQLQRYEVVQPWSDCVDLGFNGEVLNHFTSFGKGRIIGTPMQKKKHEPYKYYHCGYAWACTRRFWESVQGLIDCAILGSADYSMAWAMINDGAGTTWGMGRGFESRVAAWQRRAQRVNHGQVGFVNGLIRHGFHGHKANRHYQSRNEILQKHDFDADRDLYYDEQGVIKLAGKPALEAAIHQYNLSRNEDSF
jgi:hypothetical protein